MNENECDWVRPFSVFVSHLFSFSCPLSPPTPLGIMLIKALLFLLELIQRFSLRILLRYFLSVQFELSIYFKLPEHIRFIRPWISPSPPLSSCIHNTFHLRSFTKWNETKMSTSNIESRNAAKCNISIIEALIRPLSLPLALAVSLSLWLVWIRHHQFPLSLITRSEWWMVNGPKSLQHSPIAHNYTQYNKACWHSPAPPSSPFPF